MSVHNLHESAGSIDAS